MAESSSPLTFFPQVFAHLHFKMTLSFAIIDSIAATTLVPLELFDS